MVTEISVWLVITLDYKGDQKQANWKQEVFKNLI